MAKNIDAKLKNIQGLFSSANSQDSILSMGGTYIIPEYQRAYNWKSNEQCDKLWQDIEAFIDNKKNDSYFFGSIIINSANDELYVIDGQQRMTTFILLLKALLIRINDLLGGMSSDEDTESLKDALKNRKKSILTCLYNIDEDDVSQLKSGSLKDLTIKYNNKSINEEYSKDVGIILHEETLEDIEKNVIKIKYKQRDNRYTNFYRNFIFFADKLESYDSTKINTFAKTLLNNCQVIVVVSYNTEEAIEIFNSLNSTGMPLADADILSAKLYSNFDLDKTEFNRRWGDIVARTNSLESQKICSIDDILNQYMYILRAKNYEKDTTLPGVRRYFTDINKQALNNPQKFLSDFEQIIDIWTDCINDDGKNEEGKEEILTLKQILFNFNNNFKFFYATYLFFNKNKPNSEKLLFITALLKLFTLLAISDYGYSSSKFKVFLIGLNMEIGSGVATNELVRLINSHIQNNFDKKTIMNSLQESYPANGLLYLNEYLFAKEHNMIFSFSTQKNEIEHIMPESGKNIIAIRTDAEMDEETFNQYVNKLGNKILLEQPINGSLSNDWFRVKKQNSVKEKRGYKDSVFPIAQCLVSYPSDRWTKEDINAATEKAAKRIVKFLFE